jgi:ParB-like nuclease domain
MTVVPEGITLLADQTYAEVDIDLLDPHPLNPNRGDGAAIAESIATNSFYGAVTVRRSPGAEGRYQILAGEHRWRELTKQGALTVPVIVQHDCNDVRAARIMLADNETARRATREPDAVARVLASLESLIGTGFDLESLALLEASRVAMAEEAAAANGAGAEPLNPDDLDDEPPAQTFVSEYAVVVMCADEAEQKALYERFTDEGLRVRIVAI